MTAIQKGLDYKKLKNRSAIALVLMMLFGFWAFYFYGKDGNEKTTVKLAPIVPAVAAVAAPVQPTATDAQLGGWRYDSASDPMTGKIRRIAWVKSTESLSLLFPYEGNNFGQISIRNIPGKADDVLFSIEKGQTMCKSYGEKCTISVRFDDNQPTNFYGHAPADNSTTLVFLEPSAKFIAAAKKANRIRLALTVYHNGTQVLDFVMPEDFTWPK